MANYVKVAKVGDLEPGERLLIDFEDVTVALFNIADQYYCIEDLCTHDGGPVAEGELDDHVIECPRHGALFDVRDGSVLSMPAVIPVPTYEVVVDGDDILIDSPDEY